MVDGGGGLVGGSGGLGLVHGMGSDFPVDDGVESVVGVSRVLYGADRTVRLSKAVGTLDNVSVAGFVLALGVSGMRVLYGVVEAVLGVGVVLFYASGHRGGDYGCGVDWGGNYWGGVDLGSNHRGVHGGGHYGGGWNQYACLAHHCQGSEEKKYL